MVNQFKCIKNSWRIVNYLLMIYNLLFNILLIKKIVENYFNIFNKYQFIINVL